MKLTILGCNSATPKLGRMPTAQVLNINEQQFLIDCAEGTQIQMMKYGIKHSKISHCFISHMHGDHYFGLIGLLNTMSLNSRTRKLHIYCPEALPHIIDAHYTNRTHPHFTFEIEYHIIAEDYSGVILDTKNCSVRAVPTDHSIPCHGFMFEEKKSKFKLIPELCESFQIPIAYYNSLKAGLDYTTPEGQIISYQEVTEVNNSPVKSYAYTADTAYNEQLAHFFSGVSTIYHESTYLDDQKEKAHMRKHSTASQAARIAELAGAQKLILGHFSSSYSDLQPFLAEAMPIFSNTELAEDGKEFMW